MNPHPGNAPAGDERAAMLRRIAGLTARPSRPAAPAAATAPPADLTEALERLRAFDWLTATPAAIEAHLPTLGMNDEYLDQMPRTLRPWFGSGLRFWQYPNQFAGLLSLLRERPAASYLEIGSRWAGTFRIVDHVLRAANPDLRSWGMDLIDCPPLLADGLRPPGMHYLRGDSTRAETWQALPPQIDVIFIDGDHSWEAVRADFNAALARRPHTIIFHDTASDACPGVRLFWQDVRRIFRDTVEFHDQYPDVAGSYLGIGVVRL